MDLLDTKKRIKAVFVGSIGNLIEWYDFYAYTAFSLYFASAFFPSEDPLIQQLNAALLFALGFIIRPVGGWLFGMLADRYGRRLSLTVSVLMMCGGSLLIALTPTYATIGIAAPIILALARVIEGLSLGGEYGASATYLTEVAHPEHRGFYSSFQYVTLIGGQLSAILVLLLLQNVFLTHEQLVEWGWRIPFFIGAILAIVAALLRHDMHETDAFKAQKEKDKVQAKPKQSTIRELFKYPREIALVVGMTAGGTAAFYTFTTYMQTFVKQTVGLSSNITTYVIAGSLIFATFLQPLYGAISDRVGRKALLIAFGIGGTLFTVPILTTLSHTTSAFTAFLLICAAWIFTACYTSINAVAKAELFPASIRATGIAVPYAVTVSVFGGTAPVIALWCKQAGHEQWFYYYLSGVIFISLLVYIFMRDTKKQSSMAND